MTEGTFLYFAYGSNMLSARLKDRKRCPSAAPLGMASLSGHRLMWHKPSTKDLSGKCDVVPASEDEVAHGVLYRISESERAALDREEGAGPKGGYKAVTLSVVHDGKKVDAASYQATVSDPSLKPWSWYRALVVAGANEHDLPSEYIDALAGVEAPLDADTARHEANMAIIPEAFR